MSLKPGYTFYIIILPKRKLHFFPLQLSGSEFGLNIKSTNKNRRNLLDFGAITTDQLVSDKYVPLGYEVSEPSDHLLVSAPFTLNIRAKAKIPISSLRIKKCIKIPRENKGNRFKKLYYT